MPTRGVSRAQTVRAATVTERITGEPHEVLQGLRAEKAKRSLLEFVRQSWQYIEPGAPFVEGWHHGAICEHLQAVTSGQIRKLVISVPPEHSKSTIVAKCWPAWGWVDNPSFDWLFSSYSAQRAIGDSVDCRRIIDSPWFRDNWASLFFLTSDQNQKTRFTNSKGGQRIAMGLLGSGTGEHADAVVCDDPHSIRDQWSTKRLDAAMQTWDQVMSRCINDPQTSRHVIIMQRIHHKDLAAHCLKQGGYDYLCLPTEYDPARSTVTSLKWKDPRKKKGELLWPGRFGAVEVADAKVRLATRGFSAQHQQDPSQEEGAIFKRDKFKYYANDPRKIAAQMDSLIQSWDMAFKDLDSSSKVAGHVWGKKGADRFLLDRVCEHLDFVESMRAVEDMSERWPLATAKIIEDKANGPAIIAALKRKVSGLIPWPPKGQQMGSKIARAYASQPEVEAGNVWLPDPQAHPWVPEFVEYCVAFPGGEYDDDIDAMTQALERFRSVLIIETGGEDIFALGAGRSYWKGVG